MAKRVYSESVKKWAKGIGISGVTLIGLIFMYLFAVGAISNVSYSGDVVCAGTELDPCYAYINFTAEEDIFIYPTDYDPWGRDTLFNFDPNVKSWKLQRSWGKGWRNIPLDKSCTGTWCGLSSSKDERKFSVAFRDGRDYQIRIVAMKNNPTETIKWGAFSGVDEIDPAWIGVSRDVGYEFLDDEVVHIWNTKADYYFNKSSGMQWTEDYSNYWTENVFCLGYYTGETWNKIKCVDELENFNKQIETDNMTYVNATLWKDFVYGGYDFRFGLQYHLKTNDDYLSVIPYMKNIDTQDIPYKIGFAWKVRDISIDGNENDRITINDTQYNLDENLDLTFRNITHYIPELNMTVDRPYFVFSDNVNSKYVKMKWDSNLNYAVKVFSDGNQSNSYVTLFLDAGYFSAGQEKQTIIYWRDPEGSFISKWAFNINNGNAYGVSTNDTHVWDMDTTDDKAYAYLLDGTYVSGLDIAVNSQLTAPSATTIVNDVDWWAGGDNTEMHKYNMAGTYQSVTWATQGAQGTIADACNNGTHTWITDHGDDIAYVYLTDGTEVPALNFATTDNAVPIGCDLNDGFIWIVEVGDNDMHKYLIDGTKVGSFDLAGSGMSNALGMAIVENDTAGTFFIADSTDNEMYLFFAYTLPPIPSILNNVTVELSQVPHSHLNISDTAPFDSLVGYWSFDGDWENSEGALAFDWSDEGNDGGLIGNAVINSSGGIYGDALILDGDGDYVDVADDPSVNFTPQTDAFTLSAWVKTSASGGGTIVAKAGSDVGLRQYQLGILSNVGYSRVGGGASTYWSTTLNDGQWHHVVMTVPAAADPILLYVDGDLDDYSAGYGAIGTNTESYSLNIGSRSDGGFLFNGSIDEVMIFNTNLTAQQVADIYNNQSARFFETGTQDFVDQDLFNISSGNNRVNVSSTIDSLFGSIINLTVGYFDGTWQETAAQIVISNINSVFTISSSATNLTLNYTFFAGNDTTSFYSPISFYNITFETFNVGVADTCTCPSVNTNWEVDMEDNCQMTSNCNIGNGNLSWIGSSGFFNCSAELNLTDRDAPPSSTIFYHWDSGCVINRI